MKKNKAGIIIYRRRIVFGRHDPVYWEYLIANDLIDFIQATKDDEQIKYEFMVDGIPYDYWKYWDEDIGRLCDYNSPKSETYDVDLPVPLMQRLLGVLRKKSALQDLANEKIKEYAREFQKMQRQQVFIIR